jgi:hypothetical protein
MNLPTPKSIASATAVLAVAAASLGATSPNTGPKLIAKANTLSPAPIVASASQPVVTQEVKVAPQVTVTPAVKRAAAVYGLNTGDIFARIRQCESHGNYSTNTGNGYYGAYQYNDSTWGGYGGYQHASDAPASVQDQKAKETYAKRGSQPWPVCGRR